MTTPAIEVRDLTKRYGAMTVLDRLSFTIAPGAKTALTGANGVGKSTLLSILSTLVAPTEGTVILGGCEAEADGAGIRRQIGVLAHRPMVYEELTPLENLRFFGKLYGVEDGPERAEALLRRVGLWRRRHEPTRILSRGMHQRLAIARALVHRPTVLLLDEPETGLDAEGVALLDEEMLQAPGLTVLAATHQLARLDQWAASRVTLDRGRIVEAAGQVVCSPPVEAATR